MVARIARTPDTAGRNRRYCRRRHTHAFVVGVSARMNRREAFLHNPFDLLAIVIITLTQWHMSRQLLAAAGRKLSARAAAAMRWAAFVFYVLMAAGFALGFSFLVSRFKLPPTPSQVAGAVAQTWLFGSTAGYLAYRAVEFLARRVWGPTFDPSRRRLLN